MECIERLNAIDAVSNWSHEYIYCINAINRLGITFNIIYDKENKLYYPKVLLKSCNVDTLEKLVRKGIETNYINTIKKFDDYFDAYLFGIDIVIFLTATIYVRYLNLLNHTNKHINYLTEELPIPAIVSKILKNNNSSIYYSIQNKIVDTVDWTKLVNSFTRQLISEWDD